jgi:hypothetical protein
LLRYVHRISAVYWAFAQLHGYGSRVLSLKAGVVWMEERQRVLKMATESGGIITLPLST